MDIYKARGWATSCRALDPGIRAWRASDGVPRQVSLMARGMHVPSCARDRQGSGAESHPCFHSLTEPDDQRKYIGELLGEYVVTRMRVK